MFAAKDLLQQVLELAVIVFHVLEFHQSFQDSVQVGGCGFLLSILVGILVGVSVLLGRSRLLRATFRLSNGLCENFFETTDFIHKCVESLVSFREQSFRLFFLNQ